MIYYAGKAEKAGIRPRKTHTHTYIYKDIWWERRREEGIKRQKKLIVKMSPK